MTDTLCQICDKQRNSLVNHKSLINPSMEFMVCSRCAEDNLEPRWLVILMGRSGKDVTKWIDLRLYAGNDITPEHLN